MKKYKLQYVTLAVAMGLSFSGSALAQNINITPPDDQKKALAYDFKNDIAYLREKPGSGKWVELGVDPEKPQVIKGWEDVKNFSIIDEKHATNNEKSLQATREILIKTVENVKELDRFVSTNMSDTATNKRNLTDLQNSHNNLDKRVTGLTERVTGLTDFVTDEMDIVDDKFTKQDAKFTALNQKLNDKIDANKRDTDESIDLAYDNIDKHEKQIKHLNSKTDQMLENDQNLMTGLNNLAAETANGFNRVEAKNQKLEQGVANLDGRVEMTEQGVARLNGRVEMTEKGVAKLDGRVKMTEQGVANLGGRVEMTEQNIAKLMPQINRNALDLKNIREDVRSLKKDAKAGIASAVALGMLPQSTVPGKSLMSLGVGHHRGQNAFALGVSTMSENNKWVAKGGMSYDTQKNVSLGGSVGFFFN
ncbi:YadA domain-containing protein [Actinobacillus seminis]|uniref:YadA domain-containing protein n=1 Tax=Actinobacillus seminis TaxID=722 RepID=A0A380V9Z1_9PAST|nr:YadA-like family protein [Actinobacillus seminis]SUU34863.1 YadA domain-containing protein [Actinobacillus seminis]